MAHLSIENLVDYVEKKVAESVRLEVETHLADCRKCFQATQEIQGLVHTLQEDSTFEPPAELVQWGVSLFQPTFKPSPAGKIRRIIASLVFDTYDQPMPLAIN